VLGDEPRDEEYSRVTDPGRYRIVHARGRVWVEVLGRVPGTTVSPLRPGVIEAGWMRSFDRGVLVRCDRAGTLPLLLLERDTPLEDRDETMAVLQISVVDADHVLAIVPDCGCDACDNGADDLLEAIDDAIGKVVGGPTVVLRGPGWECTWHPDSMSSGRRGHKRTPTHDELTELALRLSRGDDVDLPPGGQAHAGGPWVG
jgi:hypothetical protein